MPTPVLVCVAWPYANGPLHLGHVAGSLLPPDVFARYLRLRGRKVAMVSGSDMHGTPITVAAEKAGEAPEAFAARNHALHVEALRSLGIRFDLFTSTATANHRATVHELFGELLRAGYIEKRTMTAPFDPKAKRFLPDRYVEGTCPHCGFADARGDQCDDCGRTLDPQELKNPRSKLTGEAPEYRPTEHLFLLLSKLEPKLRAWSAARAAEAGWRPAVRNFTENWLREGLKDRAITRDLTYGVPIPAEVGDYPEKRIYVWFEAVCGYLSATREWAAREGRAEAWREFWIEPAAGEAGPRAYYFLGKDNIPFHTIIWPAILAGANEERAARERLALPWDVPANEFLQFSGAKFSKSRGNAFYVLDLLQHFSADQVRYYLAANMPERGDTDWTWDDFVAKVNDELVGTLGNYVNRVLAFCDKNYGGIPPRLAEGHALTEEEWRAFESAFLAPARAGLDEAARLLEATEFKKALRALVAVSSLGNKSVDTVAPWALVKQGEAGKAKAGAYLRHHLRVIRALAAALSPFLPDAADAIWRQLGDARRGYGETPETKALRDAESPKARSERGTEGTDAWPTTLGELPPSGKLGPIAPVFGKLDAKEVKSMFQNEKPAEAQPAAKPAASPAPKPVADAAAAKAEVTIDDFARIELKVGIVREVGDHPKADKLYVLKVDLGSETRQIVAGLRQLVPREKLLGKRVVIVANLKPAVLRGVESQGMLLAAEDATGKVVPLTTEDPVDTGAKVR